MSQTNFIVSPCILIH